MLICCLSLFAGYGGYEKISLSQMPSYFFGNWYDGGNGVWSWGVTQDHFRTGNIFYNYDTILRHQDGSYLLIFYDNTGCRAYLISFTSKTKASYKSLPNGEWHTVMKK